MKIINTKFAIIILLILSVIACNNGPKVVNSSPLKKIPRSERNSGIFSGNEDVNTMPKSNVSNVDLHTVKVNQILKGSKYVYLNVTEKDDTFWIATRTEEIINGQSYYYKGGLLKTNYESKEFNKTFDKIYLISGSLVPVNHAANGGAVSNVSEESQQSVQTPSTNKNKSIGKQIIVKGSMRIADLIKNSKSLNGKTVQISGLCTKVNPNIMNRNWIHLKDGSQDNYDLVITSDTFIKEGMEATIKATVVLNKDFGAGYKYDLILENGVLVQ